MNRKIKEQERMARRDVERVRRVLKKGGVKVSDLLMLQRAHDRLLEIKTAEVKELLDQPIADALESGVTPQGMVKVSLSVPRFVYHGTSEAAAANILREGITPRGDRAPNHPETPSHPECVYLTDAYALSYILDSLPEERFSRGAVLEVDLETLKPNLLPDEDAVHVGGDPRGVIEKMAEGYGFMANVIFRSLHQYGTCAHLGTVPVSGIRRAAYIPYASSLGLVMTRWKTELNWGAIRSQQQAILAWVFDGGEQPFPVPAEELIMDSGLCEKLAEIVAGSKEKTESLMAAGVRADTLWRARLILQPGLLNRDGIEVVEVTANEEVENNPPLVLGLGTIEPEGAGTGEVN